MADKRPNRSLQSEKPQQSEQPHLKSKQPHQTNLPPTEELASGVEAGDEDSREEETAEIVPTPSTGRHWLKYAGIGAPRFRTATGQAAKGSEEITSLGSLEAEILGLFWEIGRPATSMELMEVSLYKRRAQGEEPAAFATIATTMRRLTSKGLLRSYKNEKRTSVYEPTIEREKMAARILNRVSETLMGRPLLGLLPQLTGGRNQAGSASAYEAESLRRLVQALEEIEENILSAGQAAAPAGGGVWKPDPSSDVLDPRTVSS